MTRSRQHSADRAVAGSATTEMALLVVVVALLVAVVAVAAAGPVGDLAAWARRRACRVLGEPCDAPAFACSRRVDVRTARLGAVAAFVEADRTLGVRVEHLSDGTVRVVLRDDGALGAGVAPGVQASVDVGPVRLGAGASAGGGVDVTVARDVAALFPDERAARAFLARYGDEVVRHRAVRAATDPVGASLRRLVDLAGGVLGVGSDPAVVQVPGAWRETAVGARVRGGTNARAPGVATVEAAAHLASEVRVRAPDGAVTMSITGEAAGALRAGTALLPAASVQAGADVHVTVEVSATADGVAQELTVRRAVVRAAGTGGAEDHGVDVVEARLDLTVPANATAARRALAAAFADDETAALAQRIARHGTTTRLVYDGTRRRRGVTARARALVPGVAVDAALVDEALELRSASYRDGDDGVWHDWVRCRR